MTRLLVVLALLLSSPAAAVPTFTVRIIDTRAVRTGLPDAKPLQCPDAQGKPGRCIHAMSSGAKTDWPSYEATTDPAALVRLLEVAAWTIQSSNAVPFAQIWPTQLAFRKYPFGDLLKYPMCSAGPINFPITPELRLQVTIFDEARC